jgi:histidinol-phosphate/aromatic aminotransferase/cobyric acid decarboxylase-like protein/NDP-sugar pyrophosphorylase family protein
MSSCAINPEELTYVADFRPATGTIQGTQMSSNSKEGQPSSVRKAVILAAGIGDRLRPFTNDQPKCLVPINGVPILENTLRHLAALGTEEVVLVVGHHKDVIIEKFGAMHLGMSIVYVVSEDYSTTNNIYSLWLARDHLTEDILLLEADVFFERELLKRLLSAPTGNAAAVALHQSWMSGTVVRVNAMGRIGALLDAEHQEEGFDYSSVYKTINLYVFRKEFLRRYFVPQLEAYIAADDINEYYESILIALAHRGKNNLGAVICDDLNWFEIDDESDRLAAEYVFLSQEERYEQIGSLHGGYWRFGFVDHSYLYNPYYPPKTVFAHFRNHLRELALNYPSGQNVMARLVGTLIEQSPDHVVVGNGASELINIISGHVAGKLIVPLPTFNEYQNAAADGDFVGFELPAPSFELDVEAFAKAALESEARVAVVVTPNNPTSLTVSRDDLLKLASLLQERDCILLVDESFIDFASDPQALTIERWITKVPNLAVIKSLSKSFGIGGLRLGYLLTGNEKFRKAVLADLHIWNINGFAESFLRLAPRYSRSFKASCLRVRDDCDALYDSLSKIDGVTAYKPQANFVLCRLPDGGPTAPVVAKRIFVRFNLYVKHCSGKGMPDGEMYLRLASRTAPENVALVDALRSCIE